MFFFYKYLYNNSCYEVTSLALTPYFSLNLHLWMILWDTLDESVILSRGSGGGGLWEVAVQSRGLKLYKQKRMIHGVDYSWRASSQSAG